MRYPKAVVFDLDGTLVDTAADLHLVLAELMAGEDLPTPPLPEIRAMVGDGARALIQRAYAAAGEALAPDQLDRLYDRFLERYTEEPCRASALYPGAVAALDTLAAAGCVLGLCTNKPQRPSELLLDALGIRGRFGAILGGDALKVRKPDPGHLAATIERLGATPADAAMVGDSRNDALTAQALGVPCVLVSFGYTAIPPAELGAEAVIDHLDELPAALAGLRVGHVAGM